MEGYRINNVLLIGIVLIMVGSATGGWVANNYPSDQSQDDALNFNSDNGFVKMVLTIKIAYSSKIYQTNNGTFFEIIIIKNPKETAEELENELAK